MIFLDSYVRPLEGAWLLEMLEDIDHQPYIRVWGGKTNRGPRGTAPGWKGPFNTCWYGHAECVRQVANRHGIDHAFDWLAFHLVANVRDWWMYRELIGHGPNEAVTYLELQNKSDIPTWVHTAAEKAGIPVEELVHDGLFIPDPSSWSGSSYGRHHCYDWLCHCLGDDAFIAAMHRNKLEAWIPRARAMIDRYVDELLKEATEEGVAWQKAGDRHEWAHYYPQTLVAYYQLTGRRDALQLAEAMIWFAIGRDGPGAPVGTIARDGTELLMWDHGSPGWIWAGYPQYKQLYQWKPWSQAWYHGLRGQAYALAAVEPALAPHIREEIFFYLKEVAKWCRNDADRLPPLDIERLDDGAGGNALIHGGMLGGLDSWCRSKGLTPEEWYDLSDKAQLRPWCAGKWLETHNEYHHPGLSFGSNQGPTLDQTGRGNWAAMADLVISAGALLLDDSLKLQGEWLAHDYIAYFDKNWSHVVCEKGDRWTQHWKTAGGRDFYWLGRVGLVSRQLGL
jgi:hypothetical protein